MMTQGIQAALDERIRQITEKGYDTEHDKEHEPEDLIKAGMGYVDFALANIEGGQVDQPPWNWPWEPESYKPEDSDFGNLAKGMALIAAGYDRLYEEVTNGEG